jgi:hypothetical protein
VKHRFLFTLLLFGGTLNSFAADNNGTWVANIEKSQLGNPPPKSEVMKVEKTGPNAYLVTIDMVRADGQNRHQQFTRIYDGEEHASAGTQKDETETCTQVDPLTRHIIGKNKGKVSYEIDAKMASDGKTMTTRQTFFTSDGQTKEVLVFAWERQ